MLSFADHFSVICISVDLQTQTASYLEKLKSMQTASRIDIMQHLAFAAAVSLEHYQRSTLTVFPPPTRSK